MGELTITTTQQTTQLYGQSLDKLHRSKHRAWIGVRVEALLEPYWQTRPSEVVKAEMIGDWMASLEAFTPDEILIGCRCWLDNERAKPKTGDIRKIILANRESALAAQPKPPAKAKDAKVTAEQATAILKEINFNPKTFGSKTQ